MVDREKTIRGLYQHCEGSMFDRCGECPYYDVEDYFQCRDELLHDALELLKEQEAKTPIVRENSYGWKFYYCPRCEKEFYQNRQQAFCDKCGQAVKWE